VRDVTRGHMTVMACLLRRALWLPWVELEYCLLPISFTTLYHFHCGRCNQPDH
jgi:hypothetical protein